MRKMKIKFATEKNVNNCNLELVSKLRNVNSRDELNDLSDEYDLNEIEDAMFAITAEEGQETLSEIEILDLLWEEYYEHIFPEYVCNAFLNRNKERSPRCDKAWGMEKMAKITFTAEKNLNNCNPELVSKVRKVASLDELEKLFDEYDRNEVEDAMFAIAADEGNMFEDEIEELLWEHYDEHIFREYVCEAFVNRNKERRPQ